MNMGALWAAGGVVTPERFNLNGWAATAVALVTTAVSVWITIAKARESSKVRVSGDERQARVDARQDKADTVAQWVAVVAQKDRDIERKDRDVEAVTADRDRWRRIAEEYERLHDEDRVIRMIHGAADWTAIELAQKGGVTLPPFPPLMAPRTPRGEG